MSDQITIMSRLPLKLATFWLFIVWAAVVNDSGWSLWLVLALGVAAAWAGVSAVRDVDILEVER